MKYNRVSLLPVLLPCVETPAWLLADLLGSLADLDFVANITTLRLEKDSSSLANLLHAVEGDLKGDSDVVDEILGLLGHATELGKRKGVSTEAWHATPRDTLAIVRWQSD